MSEIMSKDRSERMAKDMSERMSEDMSSERVSKDLSERMSKDMSERCQKECQKICQKECQKICQKECQKKCQEECQKISPKECQKICQKECQKICQEECQEIWQKDMSKRMPEDMSERMAKDMSERMSEDMSERMTEDMLERMSERYVRRYVRKICQEECQKICQKDVRKNVRRYVRKNVKRMSTECQKICPTYIFMFVPTESCGWHLVFCFIWHTAASTVGSTLFLCKEVSLVWQPWRRLWWNVLRRSSLIGLPKELSMCGATSWLLLVLSACTCAWSCLALHMLGIWCLSWKKSWRETSGMWHMKGGLFQMRRASKSWRRALQSFVLRPRFGRMECTSGRQMMCGAEPPTQKKWKNHSGKRRASWFAHAMRCSCGTLNPFAYLDSTAFWRGGLMHVVCVCVELQAFCIFGLNCLLAGRSDALRAMTFTGTKLSWILLLLRGVR